MKRIKLAILSIGIAVGFGVFALPASVNADDGGFNPFQQTCTGEAANTEICRNNGDVGGFLKTIINVLLFVMGGAAVIMIIIGGMTYVLSNGDAALIKSAKDKILYSVIGLVVALLAYAIVNFVVTNLTKATGRTNISTASIIG